MTSKLYRTAVLGEPIMLVLCISLAVDFDYNYMNLTHTTGSQVKVPGGYYSAECNLKIFDLSTDEICTALESIDLKG